MKFLSILFLFFCFFNLSLKAQDTYIQKGEFGVNVGLAHYFGDLNPRGSVNHPKLSIGGFFIKQFTNYTAVKVSAHYASLGYSDVYSTNSFQQARNLSFNTDIFEFAVAGDFNFFKFNPTDFEHNFTPFATIGVGAFSYNPYAYYQGSRVYLRTLHTEGQTFYQGRKEYGSMAICFPIGFGFKYGISDKLNFSFSLTHRFTTTDYLDDVSSTYVGIDKFPPNPNGSPSIAGILQDRSFETGKVIGAEGSQRGWSKQKDQYIIAEIGLSYNLSSYRCPSSK